MRVIKLDAIPSTNDFIKEMAVSGTLVPFTVVMAKNQTRGRGQAQAQWVSEPGKNLTFSIYLPRPVKAPGELFGLNVAVALAVAKVLQSNGVPRISVKWPNDILSGNKKLSGILIENSIGESINSIVGIGINVNQRDFTDLPGASSMLVETQIEFDLDVLLDEIISELVNNLQTLARNPDVLWTEYHQILYCRGKAVAFELPDGGKIMGILEGVSQSGKLQVTGDGGLMEFAVREIRLIY